MSTGRLPAEELASAAGKQPILLRSDRGPEEVPPGHFEMTARRLYDDESARVQFCRMSAEGRAEEHVHDRENQVFVVLDGTLEVRAGDSGPVSAGRGDAVYLPAGTPHATVTGGSGATYFAITFPAS